jgi:hypothetical protein
MTAPVDPTQVGLDQVADELYGLPVDQFTEVRNARAKELSSAGDRDTAAQVRKLRKPSQAAWIANSLARQHPEEIKKLLDLGKDLRRAQDRSQGSDLRRLSSSRQDLVQRLLRLVVDDAKAAGVSFAPDAQRQLVATLEAAMANESAGIALKAGRLTEALSYIGFGGASESEPASSTTRRLTKKRQKPSSEQSTAADTRREALEEAEKGLTSAQSALDSANVALDQARNHHESAKVRRREAAEELRKAEQSVKVSTRELEKALARRKRESEAVRAANSQLRAAESQN